MAHTLTPARVQSMLFHRQRAMLRDIGREVGAEVVFLKAAWADPVLFGAQGLRRGTDLDVLVARQHFEAFAAALEARGFVRYVPASHRATIRWGSKEWTYHHAGGWMPVDLHRELGDAPWTDLEVRGVLARARDWPAEGESVRSLGAEDQLLYAALHYANHLYDIDGRHADDVVQLLATGVTLDWAFIFGEADRGGLRLGLQLFLEHLRARGLDVPTTPWAATPLLRVRRELIGYWVEAGERLGRRRPMGRRSATLLERPVLSDRWRGLPEWALRYAALRVLDRAMR